MAVQDKRSSKSSNKESGRKAQHVRERVSLRVHGPAKVSIPSGPGVSIRTDR